MSSLIEVKPQESISGLQHGEQNGCIGLRTRVGLHVGVFGTEKFLYSFDCKGFHLVNNLAASVITVSGISLGVFVSKIRPHSFHNFGAYKIFGGNEFHSFQLALVFSFNELENLWVSIHFLYSGFIVFLL